MIRIVLMNRNFFAPDGIDPEPVVHRFRQTDFSEIQIAVFPGDIMFNGQTVHRFRFMPFGGGKRYAQ